MQSQRPNTVPMTTFTPPIVSKQLGSLLSGPGGVPSLGLMLDAKNFPFVETAIQERDGPHHPGVIKITNVSITPSDGAILLTYPRIVHLLTRAPLDAFRYQPQRG